MTAADLKKYKDSCYSALSRDLTEFEKNFLLISGGILAFSTSFIKDVVQLPDVKFLSILFASWTLIIISIALMMHAFLNSASASDKLLYAVDAFELKHVLFQDNLELNQEQWTEIRTTVSKILKENKAKLKKRRIWAVRCFLLGVVTLSLFVSINILAEHNKVQNTTQIRTK